MKSWLIVGGGSTRDKVTCLQDVLLRSRVDGLDQADTRSKHVACTRGHLRKYHGGEGGDALPEGSAGGGRTDPTPWQGKYIRHSQGATAGDPLGARPEIQPRGRHHGKGIPCLSPGIHEGNPRPRSPHSAGRRPGRRCCSARLFSAAGDGVATGALALRVLAVV